MDDKVKVEIDRLNCDNPECDWEGITISVGQYDEYLNASCPICGECIFTEDEYHAAHDKIKSIYFNKELVSPSSTEFPGIRDQIKAEFAVSKEEK